MFSKIKKLLVGFMIHRSVSTNPGYVHKGKPEEPEIRKKRKGYR